MITLGNQFSNTHKLKITTSAATNVDYYIAGYERKGGGVKTEFSRQDRITTATTTDVVEQNSAGIKTNITYMSIKNNDAVTSNTITILYYDSSLDIEIYELTLAAGGGAAGTSGAAPTAGAAGTAGNSSRGGAGGGGGGSTVQAATAGAAGGAGGSHGGGGGGGGVGQNPGLGGAGGLGGVGAIYIFTY